MKRVVLLLLVSCSVMACDSPEAARARGGGPGGDSGNRKAVVKMHEGSRQYWRTPVRIGDVEPPSLEPARQAQQLAQQQ